MFSKYPSSCFKESKTETYFLILKASFILPLSQRNEGKEVSLRESVIKHCV